MTTLRSYVPGAPIALDEVISRMPAVRQSLLSSFDDCALSAYFDLAHGQLWSTHPQARGTIMHRAIAECLRTMRAQKMDSIPVSEALEILHETLWQRRQWDPEVNDWAPIPPEEIVRVPVRQVTELRRFISKFAADNSFDVKSIVDVERRLSGVIRYPHPETGEVVERTLTGQLDMLMYKPPAGALVVDWKDTWGLPPDHSEGESKGEEDDGSGLSWHGYFQQRFYAWLVFVNYPKVQEVTLREFYIRKTEPRPATVKRGRLHLIEQELGMLIAAFDAAVAQGKPPWPYRLEDTLLSDGTLLRGVGRWRPSPGKHCGYCLRPGQCPIADEARREGAVASRAMAERYMAEGMVAKEVYKRRFDAVKVWVDAHGPVYVKYAKGRMEARWQDNATGRGRRFGIFPVAVSDRSSKQERAIDARLVEAARESTKRAQQARSKVRR